MLYETGRYQRIGLSGIGYSAKRLGERLQAQTQVLLEEAGVELPASHFPILAALDRLGPLSVGEIAEAVGMSQPGVTRMLDKLQSDGLVKSTAASSDRRVRTIGLAAAGEKLVASSKRRVWPRVESAVADACRGRAESLLPALAALEESLLETPLKHVACSRETPCTRLIGIVWESLTTVTSPLSEGNALARRFLRDINLFASARDDSEAALGELSALVQPGENVLVLQVPRS